MAATDISTTRVQDEADVHEMRADARESGRKRRKRRLLLVLTGLLATVGVAASAYLFLVASDEPTGEAAQEVPVPERNVVVPAYVDLEPLLVPFRSHGGDRYRIALALALEVDRAKGDDVALRSRMPPLREAYLRVLTERPLPGTEDGTIEVVYLKNRIRAVNLEMLGRGVVRDVLVRNIRVVRVEP